MSASGGVASEKITIDNQSLRRHTLEIPSIHLGKQFNQANLKNQRNRKWTQFSSSASTDNQNNIISRRSISDDCYPSVFMSSDASYQEPDCDSSTLTPPKGFDQKQFWPTWATHIKLILLVLCWLLCSIAFMMRNEGSTKLHQISVPPAQYSRGHYISELPSKKKQVIVTLQGAILPSCYGNLSTHWLAVWIELVNLNVIPDNITDTMGFQIHDLRNVTQEWRIPIVSPELIGFVPEITKRKRFEFNFVGDPDNSHTRFRLRFRTNLRVVFPIAFSYHFSTIDVEEGVLYGGLLLIGLYGLIISEIVHRTLAAMLACTISVAILAALDDRPSMQTMVSWVDAETVLLLFSMMILVAIFSETGVFDYMAVTAFQITNGKVWPLVTTLCFFTAVVSSFLDNVTTVLLMTPVTIRLCEVTGLNPVPVLMIMVIYSNIGGALTPVGDPPNVIIASNSTIIRSGVNFSTFFVHMGIGVILSMIVIYIHLRIKFRNISDLKCPQPQIQDLRHELKIWQRTATSLSSYSKNEDLVKESLMKKTRRILNELRPKMTEEESTAQEKNDGEKYMATLKDLKERYPIRDLALLVKSVITLTVVIAAFFLHSIPFFDRLGLGWTAFLGVLLLLLLADPVNMDVIIARVEWSTLIFFTCLFILMEALSKLGFIDWIGHQTQAVILSVDKDYRLAVAILLILWVSAAASAFVDNIPLATMMVRIATSLSEDHELNLPLQPLVWALSFGACLGGSGTLFGSSANVICAGVAEQHGYKFTFIDFFKLGFPITVVSMIVISIYLMIAHVWIGWNY